MIGAAGGFLSDARARLLPVSIPYRYFAAAIVFHGAAWVALALAADQAVSFNGGLGPTLAAVHLLTLGVLAMTAIGAALQLLPVATGQGLTLVWAARLAFWLYLPGVIVLVYGMSEGRLAAVDGGGTLIVLGLGLFALAAGSSFARASDFGAVAAHGWASLVCLGLLALLALLLIADLRLGFLPDHYTFAVVHLVLGAYGFMGLLAIGFSLILVPMFALASAPASALGYRQLWLAAAALGLGAIGTLSGDAGALATACLLGLAAVGLHLTLMRQCLAQGMRKRLGLSFVLIKIAWALLPLSLVLGLAVTLDLAGPRGPTLFAFVLLFGWLLTFLLAILQRILPFLAAMHAAASGPMPLLSALGDERWLKLHAAAHLGALAAVAVGILFDLAILVAAGAWLGAAGSVAYAWFAVSVIRSGQGGSPARPRA